MENVDQLNEQFTDLFVSVEPELYKFAFSLCPNKSDVDDIMQDAMTSLWNKFSEFDQEKPFLPWARQFVYQTVLSHRRNFAVKAKHLSEITIQLLNEESHSIPTENERLKSLNNCLSKLKKEDQELIKHRYQPRATLQKMAEERNKTVNALSKRLQKLKIILSKCVSEGLAVET